MTQRKAKGLYIYDGAHWRPLKAAGVPGPSPTAPGAPTGLDAAPSSTSVVLTWVAPVGGSQVDNFEVQQNGVTIATPGGTTYTVTGLTPLLTYTFRVRSVGVASQGEQPLTSAWVSIQVQTTAALGPVIVAEGDSSTTGQSWTSLDSRLAARMSTTTPLLSGNHGYSGNSFPSSFNSSSVKQSYDYGCSYAVLNVKCDWGQLANGTLDARIQGWPATIPAGFTLYLLINHEPENDGKTSQAATWRAGQARAANLIASMNDPRLYLGVCLMTYTWKSSSGRNPNDWNPAREGTMTQAALARTVWAPDGYTNVRNSSGSSYDTMASEFDAPFAAGEAWGFGKRAISEHTLNNNQGAPATALASIWNTDIKPYIANKGLTYYAFYNHQGPAAGTSPYIDTPEEETAFGQMALEYRR